MELRVLWRDRGHVCPHVCPQSEGERNLPSTLLGTWTEVPQGPAEAGKKWHPGCTQNFVLVDMRGWHHICLSAAQVLSEALWGLLESSPIFFFS